DDVHAHATTGDVGGLGRGREAGGEDQLHRGPIVHAIGHFLGDDLLVYGARLELVRVHAAAVVLDGDDDVVLLVPGRQLDGPGFGLAAGLALIRHLQAVVDGIAQQVNDGVVDLLDDRAVELRFLAFDDEIDLFVQLAGQVAHQTRELVEDT